MSDKSETNDFETHLAEMIKEWKPEVPYDYTTTMGKKIEDFRNNYKEESGRIKKFIAGKPKDDYAEGLVTNQEDAWVSKNTELTESFSFKSAADSMEKVIKKAPSIKSFFFGKKPEKEINKYDKQNFKIPGLKKFNMSEFFYDKNVFYKEEDYDRAKNLVDKFKVIFKDVVEDFTDGHKDHFDQYFQEWTEGSKDYVNIKNEKDYLNVFSELQLNVFYPCHKSNKLAHYFSTNFIYETKTRLYIQSGLFSISGTPVSSGNFQAYTKK